MSPMFSIVIANYNYGFCLEDAIRSVLNQGMDNDVELIICDGGSTDNSLDIIKKYENRIAWWCSEKDSGQSDAFNKGFSKSTGKLLAWLNADDLLLPGALLAIKHEYEMHPECEWFIGSSIWCDANLFVKKVFCAHRFSEMRFRARRLTCGGPSSFFTKRILDVCGGFDESLHYIMDNDLWYRFVIKAGVRYRRTTKFVWAYRIHELSKMSGCDLNPNSEVSKSKRQSINMEQDKILQRYGRPNRFWQFTRWIPVSFIDAIIACFNGLKMRNRHLNSIFHHRICCDKILLSNCIQEYMTGLNELGVHVYAPNNWRRKTFIDTENRTFISVDVYNDIHKCATFIEQHGISVLYAQGMRSLIHFKRIQGLCKGSKPIILTNCHSPSLWDSKIRSLCFILLACLYADGVIFLVERTRKKWQRLCGLFGVKTYHIPNPVDIKRFPAGCNVRDLHKPFVIGCIGTIEPRKCQHLIVAIVKSLLEKGYEVRGSIVGDYVNDEYKDFVMREIVQCKVEKYVSVESTLDYDKVPAWMDTLDIYICPSNAEVMPFSILEAIASGLPVVGHDIAGLHEEIRDGINGFLVKSEFANEYVDKIEQILRKYNFYSAGSRKLAEQVFSTSVWAHKVDQCLCLGK